MRMTLRQRNVVFSLLLFLTICILAAFFVLVLYVCFLKGWAGFLSSYRIELLVLYFFELLFSLVIMLVSKNFYKTSINADFYFFVLFVFSTVFEFFRLFNIFSDVFMFDNNSLLFIYRLIYLGYFMGLSSFFLFSFFSLAINYQRIGRLSLWMMAFSAFLAWFMPLNTSLFFPSGVPVPLFMRAFLLFSAGVCVLSVVCVLNGHDDYGMSLNVWKAVFSAFSIAGRAVLFFVNTDVLYNVTGFVLFGVGIIYVVRKLYQKEIL